MTHETRMLIDGKLVESETGRQFDNVNPATEEVLGGTNGTRALGINGGLWHGADAPYGGYKQSGIGRQCGLAGLEIFTETKTVGWPTS